MLNPELCLIEQQSAANTVYALYECVCDWVNVKRFEWSSRLEKRYINTSPFTIYFLKSKKVSCIVPAEQNGHCNMGKKSNACERYISDSNWQQDDGLFS